MLWDPLNAWPAGRRWLWGLLAIVVTVTQGPDFIGCLRPSRETGIDFCRNWIAARYILEGRPVYSDQEPGIGRYLGYRSDPDSVGVTKLTHPPPAALLAVPFASLDYPDATLAWNVVSLFALAVSLWLIGRNLAIGFSCWAILPLTTLILLCNPLRQQLQEGQLNLLLLVLLIGAWVAARSGRLWWAGGLVGAATAIKLFPGFVLLHFLVRREWKALAAGVASFAIITALTMLIVGPEAYRTYVTDVLPLLAGDRANWLNSSLVGFWSKLFDPGNTRDARFVVPLWRNLWVAQIGIVISVGVTLVLWARHVWSARSREECDRAFGQTLTTMLLVSPVVWDHYFLLLALPIALTWLALPDSPWIKAWLLVTLVALWIDQSALWVAAIPGTSPNTWSKGVASPMDTLTVLSFQFYSLLSLFILGLIVPGQRTGAIEHHAQLASPPGSVAKT